MREIDFYADEHKSEIESEMTLGADFADAVAAVAVDFFAHHGFTVNYDGIIHNVEAWEGDYKSGWLDEANNVFLFSPCGCNPLRINASEYVGEPWQETYIA